MFSFGIPAPESLIDIFIILSSTYIEGKSWELLNIIFCDFEHMFILSTTWSSTRLLEKLQTWALTFILINPCSVNLNALEIRLIRTYFILF